MKKKPSMLQAGDYSATTTYLKAVAATGSTDGDTVMKWLKANPVNDFFVKDGKIRADGLMVHDMFPVSYTHLDVYKRQMYGWPVR